ncbi:hypothetical protein V2J09_004853 [Rumex salicifolius]
MDEREWVGVRQLPNLFIVNINDQLEVLSNMRYKMYKGGLGGDIGPIEDLVDDKHTRMYNSYKYKEYIKMHEEVKGKRRKVKEAFLVNPPDNLEIYQKENEKGIRNGTRNLDMGLKQEGKTRKRTHLTRLKVAER